jgi:tetratricopeptide (TPR) repeat protein
VILAKRKGKKQRTSRSGRRAQSPSRPTVELQRTLARAERLIEDGNAEEAAELLEPLLASYPRVADLHYYYGYACATAGDLWTGLTGYEQAIQLSRDSVYWLPLGWLYLDLDLQVHALQAFRKALRQDGDIPEMNDVPEVIAHLEEGVQEIASELGLSIPQTERGLRFVEVGGRALQEEDYAASIAANRQAIRLLGDWPPPLNNLSMALFYDGQPQKAIATARQVLAQNPANVQALSNATRFLVWTGRGEEAQALWPSLKAVEPLDAHDRVKMAEAAAVLNQDQDVYDCLKPLDKPEVQMASPGLLLRTQHFLAVAEANMGKRGARRRLRDLPAGLPWVGGMLAALKNGQPGLGWADRFSYFHIAELMPWDRMEEFLVLAGREREISDRRFREQVARLVERFPQLVLVAEKVIWEEQQADEGMVLLEIIGTPAAYAALRRFGLSQAGDDETRLEALFILQEAGEIAADETLCVWSKGEWREIKLHQFEISEDLYEKYAPEVIDLLDRGTEALEQDQDDQAEQLLRGALELDPNVKEAYNNLAVIYGQRGDVAQARAMCQAALEIDPLYVIPRCNLALHLLDDDDVQGAIDMLRPLADVTRFHPLDMAFYSYVQAQIYIYQGEYGPARNALAAALEVWPGHELAEEALQRLDIVTRMRTGFDSFFEQQRKREQAHRARMQAKLSMADPTLPEALALHTKEGLTGMGHVVLAEGGWSGLRKAELLERILEGLNDVNNLQRMVGRLTETDRMALRQVLTSGGHMPWRDFDAEYGNDLEESRYWQWHVPQTTMGRLRHRGLLVETTVDGELLVAVPSELRQPLEELLEG